MILGIGIFFLATGDVSMAISVMKLNIKINF